MDLLMNLIDILSANKPATTTTHTSLGRSQHLVLILPNRCTNMGGGDTWRERFGGGLAKLKLFLQQTHEEGKDHGAHTQQEMQFKLRVPFLLTRNLSMD